jgi:hypothetical protein
MMNQRGSATAGAEQTKRTNVQIPDPRPSSYCANNLSGTDHRRTAARASSRSMSDRTQDHWTQTLTHLVGPTFGQPTAPENRWHRRRRLPSSIPRLLCHHTAAEANGRGEQ